MRGPLDQLTDRQREVLRLLARGHTNGEIAERLGISFDGAKWHVSEIISRLGVSPVPLPVAAGAAVLAGLAVIGIVVAALSWRGTGDDASPPASPSETATAFPGASATPGVTPTVPAVTGLFTEPQAREPDRVVTLDFPASPFPEWDGDAVIYDIARGETIDLGPGAVPLFNPGGTLAAWVAGDVADPAATTEVRMIDLVTHEQAVLGPGDSVWWHDDVHVAFGGRGNPVQTLDLVTGELTPGGGSTAPPYEYLTRDPKVDYGYTATWSNLQGERSRTWSVTRNTGQAVITDIDAYLVTAIDPLTIAVVTATQSPDAQSNLFLVDLESGRATFIASTRGVAGNGGPIVGSKNFLIWSGVCTQGIAGSPDDLLWPGGDVLLFNRQDETITRVTGIPERSVGWKDTRVTMIGPDRVALGSTGAYALVDTATLTVEVVLPAPAPSWTANRLVAANGWTPGRGLCS